MASFDLTRVDQKRFWSKVDKRGLGDCWLWLGSRNGKGYGTYGWFMAHVVAYVLTEKPDARVVADVIPKGMTIDHTCTNQLCCNPRHMDVVTRVENTRRSRAVAADRRLNG